jgi:HEAT repeat protein
VRALLQAIAGTSDKDMRLVYARILARIPEADLGRHEILRLVAGDDDARMRHELIGLLGEMGESDAETKRAVLNALSDVDEDVRALAAWELGAQGGKDVVEALASVARDPRQTTLVVTSAIKGLGRTKAPAAMDALTRIRPFALGDPLLAAVYVDALLRFDDVSSSNALVELLGSQDDGLRGHIIARLPAEGTFAFVALRDALDNPSLPSRTRQGAVRALLDVPHPHTRRVLEAHSADPDPGVRREVEEALLALAKRERDAPYPRPETVTGSVWRETREMA